MPLISGYRDIMKSFKLLKTLIPILLVVLLILPGIQYTAQNEFKRLKVVVISVDAVRFDHITQLAVEGQLPNIAKLMSSGIYAEMVVVFPTATAVSHAAISTGAPPGVNGIVGNSIHLPNTSVTSTTSGFSGFNLLSEPIWMTADRYGLKSIVVSFPQSTPRAWNVSRSILFNFYDASAAFTASTLYTTNRIIGGATYIDFTNATEWINVEKVFGSVVRALESSIKIGDTTWYLYLADLNGDDFYDKLAIAPEKDLLKAYAILSEGEWSNPINTTIVYANKVYTISPLFKAIKLNPVSDFRLYRGLTRPFEATWYNNADVAWSVWNNVFTKTGTFTDGDYVGLTRGWFNEETYIETVNYTNRLFAEWTVFMIKNYEWDLILTYTPVIDNVYHQFLGLVDPSMPYYDSEKAKYYWDLIVRTYKIVDEFVGAVLESVPPDTVVILLSDHGQVPIKKIVYINGILCNRGYVAVDAVFRVNVTGTLAYAPWHVHIFVNLAGRESGGIVPPANYSLLVDELVRVLWEYRDPETGERVFDLVLPREKAEFLGLTGERIGDVIFALKPGYTSSTALVRDPETGKAVEIAPVIPLLTSTGDHGPHLPHYKELRAVLIASGPGISGGYLGTISSLQVAATIASLLGISPPRDSKLAPIFISREALPIVFTYTSTITTTITSTTTTTLRERVTTTATTTLISPVSTTVTETIVDYTLVRIVGLIALIVGIVVGYVLRRK